MMLRKRKGYDIMHIEVVTKDKRKREPEDVI